MTGDLDTTRDDLKRLLEIERELLRMVDNHWEFWFKDKAKRKIGNRMDAMEQRISAHLYQLERKALEAMQAQDDE